MIRVITKMSPPPKLQWTPSAKASKSARPCKIVEELKESRSATAPDVTKFDFNSNRVKKLGGNEASADKGSAVGYWIHRDQRVQDNWAALHAQKLALQNRKPLHFAAALAWPNKDQDPGSTLRHYSFSLGGHEEVAKDCQNLNIQYHMLTGAGEQFERVQRWVKEFDIGCLVVDFSPLKPHKGQVKKLLESLGSNGPLVFQVDGHNVIPVWMTSPKHEPRAYLIRSKIDEKVGEYLTEFPPVIRHPFDAKKPASSFDWKSVMAELEPNLNLKVKPVDWAKPGTSSGLQMLDSFVHERFDKYAELRNVPTVNHQSNLSPWFHFGQVSPQRALLHAKKYNQNQKSMDSFINECLVWRELSENFCLYVVRKLK